MADGLIEQFCGITGSNPAIAIQYLNLSDENLEAAIQLFFENDGIDLQGQATAVTASSTATNNLSNQTSSTSRPHTIPTAGRLDSDKVITIDSDNEDEDGNGDGPSVARKTRAPPGPTPADRSVLDDEAMARQMQEELYADGFGGTGAAGAAGQGYEEDGVRAPMARTTETLVGPGADMDMPVDLRAAVEAQMAARRRPAAGRFRGGVSETMKTQANVKYLWPGRPGIFNQQPARPMAWENDYEASERRRLLSQATGGASETSSKASLLAEMYRPPHEIISMLPWDDALEEGKAQEKWILVNVQDPSIFDCQVLNRDIWKHSEVKETIKEHFIFMQFNKGDPRGAQYAQFYFKNQDEHGAYPHIAIVDPRTGEQVKVWSGPPVPKPMDYLMQLHEFLDRYSLKANAKNPVATRRPEPKKTLDVNRMTEEEMLELALQNSLGSGPVADTSGSAAADADPDALTRNPSTADAKIISKDKGKAKAVSNNVEDDAMTDADPATTITATEANGNNKAASTFSGISANTPHLEPSGDPQTTTRIQFRHSGGRIIRRFALSDPVRRIYEWLKNDPVEGKSGGLEFELVCMGKNLIEHLDESIEQAGLKNQTVMVEFVED
jgi:hypothetical protein